jgi:AraC family transcriptional activator of pobA
MNKFNTMGKSEPVNGYHEIIQMPAGRLQAERLPHEHFNVFLRGEACKRTASYLRRDFFKIGLVIGSGKLHYADRTIEIEDHALVFYNPQVPYSWEAISETQAGYFCLFKEEFISTAKEGIQESPLFKKDENPVFFLDDEQFVFIDKIFKKMLKELESDYIHKYDLMRHYTYLILHEAMKMKPVKSSFKYINASNRIALLFTELLERQFPVDSAEQPLQLKTPQDFAGRLSVHVNHLNRAVKEVKGKSTSQLIADRVASEAKSLLKFTENNVAEIAYGLGFEHASNFNTFFKKHTGATPKSFR